MAATTAAEVRLYLAEIDQGRAHASTRSALFADLRAKGAVAGSPEAPELTPVGRHVLRELDLRAYRVDALPLDAVSAEISSQLMTIDSLAHRADFFLGDLGPLAPADALPYLRVASAALVAGVPDSEELAELFRNLWGMVEVLAGAGEDRILATEMLALSSVPVSRLYAPITQTLESLRGTSGAVARPVSVATILHLFPAPTPVAAMAGWSAWRARASSDLAAAVLAGTEVSDAALAEATQQLVAAGAGAVEAQRAAVCLLLGDASGDARSRALDLGGRLSGKVKNAYVAAALLATAHTLSAAELADWVEKAVPIAEARRLAPTAAERYAVAVALVLGLDRGSFRWATAADARGPLVIGWPVLALLALHAWIYHAILERPATPSPAAVGSAGVVPSVGA